MYPNGEALALAELRQRLTDPRVAVRLGIIDSCRGGGWTGAKGLSETDLFEVDLPAALASEGSVLIASSSGLEDAHESEQLGGSFFTHHWVAALRGAGDRNTDGQVTLTEAFDYARALTIRDTALYTASPQHPSFSMQLKGRHDLALSTLSSATALVSVDQREGPLELVHLNSGLVVLELPKGSRSLRLAVAPGRYLLRRRSEDKVWAHELEVRPAQTVQVDEARLTLVGSGALVVKQAAPRPLTLSTLPAGKQEATFWIGVRHENATGLRVTGDDGLEFGFIAPRGLTDRWQWLIPSFAFVYRGGDHGGIEWLPWGGIPGWRWGYSAVEKFIIMAQPGVGFDMRFWLNPHSSLDLSLSAVSYLRWTSRDPNELTQEPMFVDGRPPQAPRRRRWQPPNSWRTTLSFGYTHTLSHVVTLHLSMAVAQNQLYDGEVPNHGLRSNKAGLVLAFGSVQQLGLRATPLVRIHVRDWFALNADISVSYSFANNQVQEKYLAGASFVW